ncbi:hypothetical protein GCM10028825_46380 [Spirosoma agri]
MRLLRVSNSLGDWTDWLRLTSVSNDQRNKPLLTLVRHNDAAPADRSLLDVQHFVGKEILVGTFNALT